MDSENLSSLISALRAETANGAITPESLGSILQKMLDTVHESVGGGINIVCDTKNEVLYVRGASALATMGFIPCIFRYTVKSNHLTNYKTKKRYHGPIRRGWHLFYSTEFARIEPTDAVAFNQRDEHDRLTGNFSTSPHSLVKVSTHYTGEEVLDGIFVGFGKRTLAAIKGRRLKFGIGFIRPVTNMKFHPKLLVTNIAPFKVHVRKHAEEEKYEVDFCI